eukprot:TRINITY_DN12161_c0_g1_i5.p2 TRINITY_DN12161_c0_g1~~TRINITY_DN12161_c0_g1_i5.p2  ORF type:complete len:226 (-),score=28.18 TRINITY_DN12161_c0_g1_i5:1062-1739(-)
MFDGFGIYQGMVVLQNICGYDETPYTCEEQKNFGACGEAFMQGYCECTCGVCQQEADNTDSSQDEYSTSSEDSSFSDGYQEATSKFQPDYQSYTPDDSPKTSPSLTPPSMFFDSPSLPPPSDNPSAPVTQDLTCGALFALSRQLSLKQSRKKFGKAKVQSCIKQYSVCKDEVASQCCSEDDHPLLCSCDQSGNCGNKLDIFSTVPSLGLFIYLDEEDNQCKCPLS